ncbi:DUF3618 domain-containing protein [Streptomyces sp. PKU-EA00015]|uniref:DUF3618 domain-containing protein n=1 Tax=Streptomyces sp. PKU-EA00015 TaxID=2748326 RepID=UPI00210ED0A6|nr:DUF3618 domain-containing protein [Streptomyces sp. PKU-EA00015]
MGTSPDRMRAEIESTRRQLSYDVDELADRTSPRRMARRRSRRLRGALSGARDRVMGTASHATSRAQGGLHETAQSAQESAGQAADTVRDAAGQAGDAAKRAPEQAMRQTQGNPLAAGLIAFGAGLLAASLLPASEAGSSPPPSCPSRPGTRSNRSSRPPWNPRSG